jgi:hypothetical protein
MTPSANSRLTFTKQCFDVPRAVQNVKHFDPARDTTIENHIIARPFDAK